MTYEEVKAIQNNPAAEDCDNQELSRLIDEAIEKQIPAKPLPYKGFDGQCPDCKVIFLDRATNYCGNCGKKIDWEEE